MAEKKILKQSAANQKSWSKKSRKAPIRKKEDEEQLIRIDKWKHQQEDTSTSSQIPEKEEETLADKGLYGKGLTTFKPLNKEKAQDLKENKLLKNSIAPIEGKRTIGSLLANESQLKVIEAKKYQILQQKRKESLDPSVSDSSSPLQMHIIQSENLRIAQDKLNEIEQELYKVRKKNTDLISASEVLKGKNEKLESEMEELRFSIQEKKAGFEEEKKVLLSTLEEAKAQIIQLRSSEGELKKQMSGDFQNVRARENTLESRLEILKMESSVLQLEKDKTIIELKNQTQKLKLQMDEVHKKNRYLQTENNELRESSRRVVSALRATIFNLEGSVELEEKKTSSEIEE